MLNRRAIMFLGFILLTALLLGGCSAKQAEEGEDPGEQEIEPDLLTLMQPLTLKVWTGDNEQMFRETTAEPILQKYPNVTLEHIPLQSNPLDQLILGGNPPDLIRATKNFMIFQVMPARMEMDLNPLIRKHNYDLNRYDPDLIKSLQSFSDGDQLYGLPTTRVGHAMLYNKRLFDDFAVPHPEDGMTWDQAIDLARRMTRVENDVQYRGLDLQFYNMIASQLNLAVVDPNGKANMAAWTRPAEMFRRLYSIPGNNVSIPGSIARVMDGFYQERLAMVVINPGSMISAAKENPDMNWWDMVTVPVYPEAPGVDPYMNYTFLGISPTTNYPDEAFKIIAHLNSDEVQTANIRKGHITVLNNPAIQSQYGAEMPEVEGKNVQAMFKHRQSDPYVHPLFDNSIDSLVRQKFNEIITGNKDNNTILRELDELIEQRLKEKTAQ